MASSAGQLDVTPYVFVSYASADAERVLPIVEALRRAGIAVWLDQQSIAGGENYGLEIAEGIERCAALVLMCSARSLASRNVKQEVALAWRFGRLYLPLLLEDVAVPKDLLYWLEASQWVEIRGKSEAEWLPPVLVALAALGIAPRPDAQAEIQLAGRERELAALRERLDAAKEGRGSLVLIGGEAGIGKTTLAEAALRDAGRDGFAVLEGHCFDLAETPPYGSFIDLFGHCPSEPAFPPLPEAFAARGTVGAVANQMALFLQVEDFLTALSARQPVVVLLDDLHWADAGSLDLLRFLSRSVADMPLLVLVTYRSDELTRRHPLYQLLPALRRDASVHDLNLGRLDDDAVRVLIETRYQLPDTDADRLAAYLQSRAEGNALFLGELLRSLEESGGLRHDDAGWTLDPLDETGVPPPLRQVIDARVSRLGEEGQRLLGVAAVIGHEVPLAVWSAVGETGEDAVLAVAEQALDARLLVEATNGEAVRFAHALVREALYEGIPSIRRWRIHRRVGEALAAMPQPDPDAVAYHFQQAGDGRAAAWLVSAGERAHRAYAWLTAADRFESALVVMEQGDAATAERGWLLYRLAFLRRYQSPAQALRYIEEAEELAVAANDQLLVAHAMFYKGYLHITTEGIGLVIEITAKAIAAFEMLTPSEIAHRHVAIGFLDSATVRGTLMVWLTFVGRFAEAEAMGDEFFARGAPPLGAPGSASYADALSAMARIYAYEGRIAEARAYFARTRAVLIGLGHHYLVGMNSVSELWLIELVHGVDRIARQRLAAEAAEALDRAGGVFAGLPARYPDLPLMLLEGEWEEARQVAEATPISKMVPEARIALGILARAQGDPARAWSVIAEHLPEGVRVVPGEALFSGAVVFQRLAVALCLDANDLTGAREWLEMHDHWLDWSGAVIGRSEGAALWAQYHRQAGEMEQAREHAGRALAHATEPRQPLALLAVHRLVGELDAQAGRFADAEHHLNESFALADMCHASYERALTLLAMAELRATMGERDEALQLVNEVRTICEPLGAKPALARADALAVRLPPAP